MIENLELVIFDMDGLMFDTERYYCDAAEKLMKKRGISVNIQALYDIVGTRIPVDMKKFNLSSHPDEEVQRLLHELHLAVIEELCKNGVPIKKGLLTLLDKLSLRHIPRVVATSTEISIARRLLNTAGVWDCFDFVVTGLEVAHGKPAPDIFLEACRRIGVLPEHALVLEDSILGAQAAKSAGIRYIIVPDINQPTPEVALSAYKIADSLLEVSEMI